jgi:hypothetical protein
VTGNQGARGCWFKTRLTGIGTKLAFQLIQAAPDMTCAARVMPDAAVYLAQLVMARAIENRRSNR